MLVFLTTLFVVVFAAFLARKSESKILSRCLLGIAFITMVLVATVRSQHVGTDTGGYVAYFNGMKSFADVVVVGKQMGEYGFWILNWLLHFVSDDYVILFLAIAMIVVGCYQKGIVKYSESIEISFFLFIAGGYYSFFFNGARQAIACAIYFLAIGQMLEKNFIKYLAYVLLAFLFHKTAIMMVPMYFILNRPNTFKSNLITIVIGCAVILSINTIIGIASNIDERYASYGTSGEGGGYITACIGVSYAIFFLIFKNSVRIGEREYGLFLNMYLFATMIAAVTAFLGTNPSGLMRYGLYFDQSFIFLWPIVFKNISDRLQRFVIGFPFVILEIAYFIISSYRFSDRLPYEFNPMILNLFR
jgi:EpsG family